MTTNARDHIMGSGSPAFSFSRPGDGVAGPILTEPQVVQQRDFATGAPAFWPSGDPKLQVVFQIQTNLRNFEGITNPDRSRPDNGVRTIFVKGKHFEKALKDAILNANAGWLEVGGWFAATYTGDDMTSKAGNKPKLFDVKYQAPPPQPPAHFQQGQQGYGQAQGYGNQQQPTYVPPTPPQPPVQAQPNWQQPGWGTQQPYGQSAQAVPSHHGTEQAMPDWARPSSAPPAPSSAPPAPSLSTLDMIKQAQESGQMQVGPNEAGF